MKENIQKVIKCLTCLVTCLLILVCSVTTPVQAASNSKVYSMVDYLHYIHTGETPDRWEFIVDDCPGSWYSQIGAGSVVHCVDAPECSYTIPAGTSLSTANLYYYYFGAFLSGGGVQYNYLDISMYNHEYLVSFTTDFEFHMAYFNSPPGDVIVTWMSRIKTYDANFNYLGIVTAEQSVTLPGGGASGNTYTSSVDIELSDDVYYIVPYVWLNFNPANSVLSSDLTINVKRLSYLTINTVSDYNRTDEDIAGDKLDGATGEMDNSGNILGGAVDDFSDISNQLPTIPGDFSNIAPSDDLDNAISDILKVFDWDKSGLNIMYGPLTLSLGLAVLFYVVFGKG